MISDKRFSIIVADDDGDDVMMMRKALRACGFAGDVDVASDGERLLESMGCKLPDLVLLDLNMPRKSGLEALREIKSDGRMKSVPVVIFTTSDSRTDIRNCYAAGANSYVVKPMAYAAITSALQTISNYWIGCVSLPERIK